MFYHIGIPKISVEGHKSQCAQTWPDNSEPETRPKSEVQKPRVLVSKDLTKSDGSCHSGFDTICDTCHVMIYLFAMNFGICIVSHGIFPMCQFQNSFFHIFIWWRLKLQPILTLKLYCKRLLIHGLRNMNSFEPGLRGTLHLWNVLVQGRWPFHRALIQNPISREKS